MISHKNMVSVIANTNTLIDEVGFNPADVYYSFLPLSHVLERIFASVVIYFGYKIGFFTDGNLGPLE